MSPSSPHVAADICQCPWCPTCRNNFNRRWKTKAFKALKNWDVAHHLTLTLDPKLFTAPADAFRHLQERHAISEMMRSLRRKELLVGNGYWGVLQFQKNGWPHWHFIVHAHALPADSVQAAWDNFSPSQGRSLGGVWVETLGQVPVSSAAGTSDTPFFTPVVHRPPTLAYSFRRTGFAPARNTCSP